MKILRRTWDTRLFKKLLWLCLFIPATASDAWAAPHIKTLKLAVTNPTDESRAHENVVVGVAELRRIAPDFRAVACVVTTSEASTLEEDARTLQTTELLSQADDTDGDGKYDELAFQIELKPKQTRVVTISYGDAGVMQRIRGNYPARTHAKFATHFERMGWESETNAWRIVADGPVRSVVELKYKGWAVGERKVNLNSRITQWAGKRGFEHRVTAEGANDLTLVTGLPRKEGLDEKDFTPTADAPALWRATWGRQVLKTGATATESLPNQNPGLAIIATGRESKVVVDDGLNLLVQPALVNGVASWYVLAAWEQGDSEALTVSATSAAERHRNGSLVTPSYALSTRESFIELVQQTSRRLTQPARVSILSENAAPQSAPPDTLHPARGKTYAEAIELLRQSAERTARKWEPIISQTPPERFDKNNGLGFFTEGDNQTGEWKTQKGFFWTGNFWVGHSVTHRRVSDARRRPRQISAGRSTSWLKHEAGQQHVDLWRLLSARRPSCGSTGTRRVEPFNAREGETHEHAKTRDI